MSAMIPFKQLFSLQVVVKVAIPSTGSSKAQEIGASLDPQSAVGHFHVSEEKGNAVSSLSRGGIGYYGLRLNGAKYRGGTFRCSLGSCGVEFGIKRGAAKWLPELHFGAIVDPG